uniref:Phosphodiesterase n=1 Tax=Ditylum brightwellii TaxID=49249 RepID=A0A7S1YUX3_9STRA
MSSEQHLAMLKLVHNAQDQAENAIKGPARKNSHKRVNSMPLMQSYNALPLPCRNTTWGMGLATINSITKAGSDSRAALTPEQLLGLESLRKVLMSCAADEGVEGMVPKSLLMTAQSGDRVSAYLASEFGGVKMEEKKPGKGLAALKRSVRKITNANRFLGGLNRAVFEKKTESIAQFFPQEYMALTSTARETLRSMLSWESLKRWDFNIFELSEVCNGRPLIFIGWAILCSPHAQNAMDMANISGAKCERPGSITESEPSDCGLPKNAKKEGYNFVESFNVAPSTMCEFLRVVESEYNARNPYHNATHAADVLQTTHVLLQCGAKKFVSKSLEEYSLLVAAAVHDIQHPGKNNNYQINARTEVALRYNDTAVLENMHVSRLFSHVLGARRNIDIFNGLTEEQYSSVRACIIRTVIDTDMARHFRNMSKLKGYLAEMDGVVDPKEWKGFQNGIAASKVLQFVLHLADISNPAKPAPVFEEWTDRVLEEFFAQGDAEAKENLPISPLCDRKTTSRASSQIGFIRYVVKPAFELLEQIIPESMGEILDQIDSNLSYWEQALVKEEMEKSSLDEP